MSSLFKVGRPTFPNCCFSCLVVFVFISINEFLCFYSSVETDATCCRSVFGSSPLSLFSAIFSRRFPISGTAILVLVFIALSK